MYRIKTLNKISSAGLAHLDPSRFQVGDDLENEDGILVRSAPMHDYPFPSALRAIEALGGQVIDCDAAYHEMLAENEELRNAINEKFPGVFRADGSLDRQKLGREVFAKKDRLDQLNAIVSRFLVPELEQRIRDLSDGLYAIDAINLLESGLDRLCDRTIAVTAPVELRVRRVMARDGISEEYARLRISAQKADDYYRSKCDCELTNAADSPEVFREEALLFFQRMVESIREEKRHGVH